MKRKLKKKLKSKKWISAGIACVMAIASVQPFSIAASADNGEETLLKAGSIAATDETITYEQPMFTGTAGSLEYRIPALITTKYGENTGNLVAAADARYTTTADGGGFDTLASVSSDMGKTWNYSFPIYFPDSDRYDGRNATTVIDPALVEGTDGTIYCFADVNPTGITTLFGTVNQGTGYVEIDGVDRLVLTSDYDATDTLPAESDTSYEYYVGDFTDGYAPVLTRSGNEATEYAVDEWYNIYKVSGGVYTEITQKQTNTDNDVQQNVFYKDSELHVYNTGYIWMVESHDGGCSWENPTILNPQIKRPSGEYALLVSPGKGLTTSDGTITVPLYDSQDGQENVSLMYSRDNGKTWTRTNDVNTATSESEMVELEDGTLRLFSRTPNSVGKICYSDVIVDENGEYSMGELVVTDIPCRSGCNITAITYSEKIDGKQAILVSCPSNPNGRNTGVIYTLLVNDDKSMTLRSTFYMPQDYGSGYAYSCMDELPDGSIAILYEPDEGNLQRVIYDNFDIYEILGQKTIVDLTKSDTYTVDLGTEDGLGSVTKEPDGDIATVSVATDESSVTTLTFTKGTKAGMTQAIVDGHLYEIQCGAQSAQELTISADESVTLQIPAEAEYTYEGISVEESAAETKGVLYDHEADGGTSGFMDDPNSNYTLEDAEMEFTAVSGSENAFYVKGSNGRYLQNATDIWSTTPSVTSFQPAQEEGSYNLAAGETYSADSRHMCFNPTYNRFDANSAKTGDSVDFDLLILEKKDTASEDDLVLGYQKATGLVSGQSYLIAYLDSEGIVYVMYPFENYDKEFRASLKNCIMNFQTKKYGTVTTKTITITGNEAGKASLIADGVYYDITVEEKQPETEETDEVNPDEGKTDESEESENTSGAASQKQEQTYQSASDKVAETESAAGSEAQTVEEGKVYNVGNYSYRVISIAQKTAQVTALLNPSLKKLKIYNKVILGGEEYTVTSIASSAFKNNKKITGVVISKNVEEIGSNAFAGCTKLKKVSIKSTKLKTIGAKAFYNCKKLKSITIKSRVLKKAGKNCLKGISKKAVIRIPKSKAKVYKKLLAKKGQSSTVRII